MKNDTFFWRLIPNPVGCAVDASIPFSPPSGITNESVSLNYPLLNISWHPPSVTYGSIIMYELVIGQWPVLQSGQNHTFYIAVSASKDILTLMSNCFLSKGECNQFHYKYYHVRILSISTGNQLQL